MSLGSTICGRMPRGPFTSCQMVFSTPATPAEQAASSFDPDISFCTMNHLGRYEEARSLIVTRIQARPLYTVLRTALHLHFSQITRNKAYLHDSFDACSSSTWDAIEHPGTATRTLPWLCSRAIKRPERPQSGTVGSWCPLETGKVRRISPPPIVLSVPLS